MGVSIQATVDPKALADLSKVLSRLQKETRRGAAQSVTYAALKIAQSARRLSKPSKKNRESITNPKYKQARGSFAWAKRQRKAGKAIPAAAAAALDDLNSLTPFLIVRERQGGRPAIMMPSYEKKDPRRLIENKGLAKKVWNVMVGKLGSLKTGFGTRNGQRYKVSKYTDGPNAVARIINKLSYSEKAYPGITTRAITAGVDGLNGMMDRKVKSAVDKANRGK